MTSFSNEQFDNIYPPDIEKHYWQIARTKIIDRQLRKIITGKEYILEIGCGRGVVTRELKKTGFNIFGVELADILPLDKEYIFHKTDAIPLPEDFSKKI